MIQIPTNAYYYDKVKKQAVYFRLTKYQEATGNTTATPKPTDYRYAESNQSYIKFVIQREKDTHSEHPCDEENNFTYYTLSFQIRS